MVHPTAGCTGQSCLSQGRRFVLGKIALMVKFFPEYRLNGERLKGTMHATVAGQRVDGPEVWVRPRIARSLRSLLFQKFPLCP